VKPRLPQPRSPRGRLSAPAAASRLQSAEGVAEEAGGHGAEWLGSERTVGEPCETGLVGGASERPRGGGGCDVRGGGVLGGGGMGGGQRERTEMGPEAAEVGSEVSASGST
jgi:hypothetical protein